MSSPIIKINQIPGCPWRFYVYPEISDLCNQIQSPISKDIAVSLNVVDAGYYLDTSKLGGPVGYQGYLDPNIPILDFSKEQEILEFQLIVNITWIENNKSLLDQLYATPGFGMKKYTSWSFKQIWNREYENITMGLYKKPHFDELFEIMKLMVPEIKSEEDLITYGIDNRYYDYNVSFVEERVFNTDVDCVKTYTVKKSISNLTDEYTVNISTLVCDIEKNKDILLQILNSLSK